MSLNLYFNEVCPKCNRPTMQAVIERHPISRDLAVQTYRCAECGPIKMKFISMKPIAPGPVYAP